MARTVTVSSLITRVRTYADMRSSSFVSDAEILAILNTSYCELYDTLVQAFQNYFVAPPATLTLVPGTDSYDLPDDFYKLISLDMLVGSTYQTIDPYNENERNAAIGSSAASIPSATVRVTYVPAPAVLETDSSIDGVSGWEELLVLEAAIALLDMEESDTSRLERRLMRVMARITSASQNRDISTPGRVTDVSETNYAWAGDVLLYRFYGDTIKFVSVTYLGVL